MVDAKNWLRIVEHHQMRSSVAELSRAEIRLIYEIETRSQNFENNVLKHILEKTAGADTIELIVPMFDNIASAPAILISCRKE